MSELAALMGKRFYSCPDCCTLARRVQRLEGALEDARDGLVTVANVGSGHAQQVAIETLRRLDALAEEAE